MFGRRGSDVSSCEHNLGVGGTGEYLVKPNSELSSVVTAEDSHLLCSCMLLKGSSGESENRSLSLTASLNLCIFLSTLKCCVAMSLSDKF